MSDKFALGIDFGTNSVRALVLDLVSGREISSEVSVFKTGNQGIILDESNPHVARQYPGDYHVAMKIAVSKAIKEAKKSGVDPSDIVGIGVDTTASTPIPVTKELIPVGMLEKFKENPNAQAWLWKDHTSADEAKAITELAKKIRPQYLAKCGGSYSSEWFFSKMLHCLNVDKEVFHEAYSWVECSDYIPALLAGINDVHKIKRNICAAGHKGMYNEEWGGYPDAEFLSQLAPELAEIRSRMIEEVVSSDTIVGTLSEYWATEFGLQQGIPIAAGAIDAHIGAVGSGIQDGILVKVIGTSTCDIMAVPEEKDVPDIPGVAGIVPGSVLPKHIGIEAGQSAVGDIFNWYVSVFLNKDDKYHKKLTKKASKLKAGQSGLLALDWNNGNRNILTDPKLTGLLIGQTLHTERHEVYRALIEATAYGALRIIEQIESHGIKIEKVINCGGITEKNDLVMQLYADILGRKMEIAKSQQTVALGSALMGGFAALKGKKDFESIQQMQQRICKIKKKVFEPDEKEHATYKKLYELYKKLHDAFGVENTDSNLYPVMKELLNIKQEVIKNT